MSDEAPPAGRPPLKQRLSSLIEVYGKIAIFAYLALSLAAIIGFSIAIGIGAQPSSASGFLGVIVAGWAAAKVTLPIRILVTLGLTPIIAAVLRRRRPAEPDDRED